jgi:hypothetical protein
MLELCDRKGRLKWGVGSGSSRGGGEATKSKVKESILFANLPVQLMCVKRPISPSLSIFLVLFLNSFEHFCLSVSAIRLSVYLYVLLLAIE